VRLAQRSSLVRPAPAQIHRACGPSHGKAVFAAPHVPGPPHAGPVGGTASLRATTGHQTPRPPLPAPRYLVFDSSSDHHTPTLEGYHKESKSRRVDTGICAGAKGEGCIEAAQRTGQRARSRARTPGARDVQRRLVLC
jgi:hypothetical protein